MKINWLIKYQCCSCQVPFQTRKCFLGWFWIFLPIQAASVVREPLWDLENPSWALKNSLGSFHQNKVVDYWYNSCRNVSEQKSVFREDIGHILVYSGHYCGRGKSPWDLKTPFWALKTVLRISWSLSRKWNITSEGPFWSTFFWAHKNCLWHSVLAFWSPKITNFLASLPCFLRNFTGAFIFGSLLSCLPWVVAGCPFSCSISF